VPCAALPSASFLRQFPRRVPGANIAPAKITSTTAAYALFSITHHRTIDRVRPCRAKAFRVESDEAEIPAGPGYRIDDGLHACRITQHAKRVDWKSEGAQYSRGMHQFAWRPGIGDPTIGGWVTVVLYFFAVWSTWKTAHSVGASSEDHLWRVISILFIALGINKQLDLQTALTELGRMVASEQGWYGERRIVQVWFIIGVALTCVFIAIILLIWARKYPAPTWLALIGMTTVLAFVLIRAASFHHIDKFIGDRILGLKWNWVLEMTGIATVIIASEWRRLTHYRPNFSR
jgi:hypothetical protein